MKMEGFPSTWCPPRLVIPAHAGIQVCCAELAWIPAFAGMTEPRRASWFSSPNGYFQRRHEGHEGFGYPSTSNFVLFVYFVVKKCSFALDCGGSGPGFSWSRTTALHFQSKDPLGVAVKNLLHQLIGVAEFVPFLEYAVVRNARIVAAEHDLVLEPAFDIAFDSVGEIFWRPARQFPRDVALVQRHGKHLVRPGPAGMRGDDFEMGKSGGELIDGGGMRVANHGAQAALHARAHPRRADIDHHRDFKLVDGFPKRIEPAFVDGEMAHDRMEVKTEELQIFDRSFRVFNGALALQGIDRRPGLPDHAGMIVAHPGNVFIGARRRAGDRFDIEGYEHGLDARLFKIRDPLRFAFRCPGAVPVLRQRFDVGSLGFDPGLGVGITV